MDPLTLPKRSVNKLQELAGLALEYLPITLSTSDRMPGRKAYFDLPLREEPKDPIVDYLHVFVESKLTGPPKDPSFGFTQEDVTNTAGVYVFKKKNGICEGETFSLDSLFSEIITDLALRKKILGRVEEMRRMVHLDDEFLGFANFEWGSRESDEAFGFKRFN